MSRRGKCNPRNGKGGILSKPLLVFVLAQLGPGRLALPRACSMTASEAPRNEEVKSSHFRSEWSRARAEASQVPRPHSILAISSAVLLRSSPSEPFLQNIPTVPFPAPVTPQGDPAPLQLTQGTASCHACQRSANIRLFCLTGNRPLPVPSLPSHFRHSLQPTSDLPPVPTRPSRKLRPFRTCSRTCPPGGGTVSLSGWSLRGAPATLVPFTGYSDPRGGPPEF